MAQTTRFASFGPVLFVVAPHMYIRSFNIPVTLLIDIKNANIKKKHLLMAQTARNASFGPVLLVVASRRYIHSSRMSLVPVR